MSAVETPTTAPNNINAAVNNPLSNFMSPALTAVAIFRF